METSRNVVDLEALQKCDQRLLGAPTGFRHLDAAPGGGLQRSDLVILAARPGNGKTSLALTIALIEGKRVVFFSLEMSAKQLGLRLIAMQADQDQRRLRLFASVHTLRIFNACRGHAVGEDLASDTATRAGAAPQKSIDPVVMAAAVVMRLQTIVAREITPGEMAIVTVGMIKSGTRYNIIPDEAELSLTIRTLKDEVFQHVSSALTRIARAEAAASNAPRPPEISIVESSQATYNDPEPTRQVVTALTQYFGADRVKEIPVVTASEDFSLYGHVPGGAGVPSCYYFLGVTDPEFYKQKRGDVPIPHSPFYLPDRERSLKTGLQALTVAALSQLGRSFSASNK